MAAGAGDATRWKKKADALFHLDGLQEETSNHLTSAMSSFVQRTSIVKEVCIPCSPRAPWRISIDNPSWCFKRKYFGIFYDVAPERRYTLYCSGALIELNLDAMSSPQALWQIPIRHKALRELKIKKSS
jgi:hypothetical protein